MFSPFRSAPSYLLAVLSCAVHMAALVALMHSDLPLAVRLLTVLLVILHGVGLVRHALLADGNVPAVIHVDESDILLELVNGRRIPVSLSDIYCVSSLQVVQFRRQGTGAGPGFWLTVLTDSAGQDSRRQWRAWLMSVPLRLTREKAQLRD